MRAGREVRVRLGTRLFSLYNIREVSDKSPGGPFSHLRPDRFVSSSHRACRCFLPMTGKNVTRVNIAQQNP
jgi:hypothetical protein